MKAASAEPRSAWARSPLRRRPWRLEIAVDGFRLVGKAVRSSVTAWSADFGAFKAFQGLRQQHLYQRRMGCKLDGTLQWRDGFRGLAAFGAGPVPYNS